MSQKWPNLKVVEVVFVDAFRNSYFAGIPSHFEGWVLPVYVGCQLVYAFRLGITAHKAHASYLFAIFAYHLFQRISIERLSHILPKEGAIPPYQAEPVDPITPISRPSF